MITCRVTSDVLWELVMLVSGLLRAHRRVLGTRKGRAGSDSAQRPGAGQNGQPPPAPARLISTLRTLMIWAWLATMAAYAVCTGRGCRSCPARNAAWTTAALASMSRRWGPAATPRRSVCARAGRPSPDPVRGPATPTPPNARSPATLRLTCVAICSSGPCARSLGGPHLAGLSPRRGKAVRPRVVCGMSGWGVPKQTGLVMGR